MWTDPRMIMTLWRLMLPNFVCSYLPIKCYAWFTYAFDRQRMLTSAWWKRKRHGYPGYATHLPMFDELCDTVDDWRITLFDNIQTISTFLDSLNIPPPGSSAPQNYSLYRIILIILLTVTLTLSCWCYLETFTNTCCIINFLNIMSKWLLCINKLNVSKQPENQKKKCIDNVRDDSTYKGKTLI